MKLFAILLVFVLSFVLSFVPIVFAQDITMSAEHKEYYFLVGENVAFKIEVDNTYDAPISGTLVYQIEHSDEISGTQISNTNSDTFNLQTGISGIDVNLGVHTMPTSISVDLLFSYIEGTARIVDLEPISVHIVATAQEQQESEPITASSQDAQIPSQQQQSDQMSNAQDRLQNNQMDQDSSALREEIRQQVEQDVQSAQDLIDTATQSHEFERLNEELISEGYRQTSQSANPTSDESGTFEFEYINDQNQNASITGNIADSKITDIMSQTDQELDNALDALYKDPKFQEFADNLVSNGYAQTSAQIIKQDDGSFEAKLDYEDDAQTLAHIGADIVNGTVNNVSLDANFAQNYFDLIYILIAISILVALYIIYRRYKRKPITVQILQAQKKPTRNYTHESMTLLVDAENAFKTQQQKLAYSLLGRALRLGLGHNIGIDTETSNEDLLRLMKIARKPLDKLKDCLNVSNLVVFAKHDSNTDEFMKILEIARDMIKSHYGDSFDSR